jgi:hypothetical protein
MSIGRYFRAFVGVGLAVGLAAGEPAPARAQIWAMVMDARGGVVGDLKSDEIQLKIGGKVQPLLELKRPDQLLEAPQSWVLVFEPIRDAVTRAIAFTAAADFLTKVPEGDRVFIVARGKDTLESLMPGFSADRAMWAKAMEAVPGMLPESLTGIPTGRLGGQGFDPLLKSPAGDAQGQDKLMALFTKFKSGGTSWAGGTSDQKGRTALDRLNLNDSMLVSSLVQIAGREMKTLESLLDGLADVPGQKHMIVFSRCEADDLMHPSIRTAMNQSFKRTRGDLGGPAETATLAIRDVTIQQLQVKEKAIRAGVMLYSVAGSGPNIVGNMGNIALDTGGFCFPLRSELEFQFGQGIQVFGSRYLLRWSGEGRPTSLAPVDITVKRKGVRVIAPTQM